MAVPSMLPDARQPKRKPSSVASKLALMLSAMSALALAGCQTTGSTATTLDKVQCSPWRAITYSSKHDTKPTIKQVQVHNRTGQRLGCW